MNRHIFIAVLKRYGWIPILVGVAIGLLVAQGYASKEQIAARNIWGRGITNATLTDKHSIGQDDWWANFDISFVGHDGKKYTIERVMPSSLVPNRSAVTLWQATDGRIFVKGSYNFDAWTSGQQKSAPWPTTQGTYFAWAYWSALIGLGLALVADLGLSILEPRWPKKPEPPSGSEADSQSGGPSEGGEAEEAAAVQSDDSVLVGAAAGSGLFDQDQSAQ